MADLTEAIDALVQIAAAAVYPDGAASPSATGKPVILYQGWPEPQSLQADLAVDKTHVSFFPRPGSKVTSVAWGDMDWVEVDNDGTQGTGALELLRQTVTAQVTIWAGKPATRDALGKILAAALIAATRYDLADGTQAVLSYLDTIQIDQQQKSGVYRRDMLFHVNFATTRTEDQFAVTQPVLTLTAGLTDTAVGPTINLPRS